MRSIIQRKFLKVCSGNENVSFGRDPQEGNGTRHLDGAAACGGIWERQWHMVPGRPKTLRRLFSSSRCTCTAEMRGQVLQQRSFSISRPESRYSGMPRKSMHIRRIRFLLTRSKWLGSTLAHEESIVFVSINVTYWLAKKEETLKNCIFSKLGEMSSNFFEGTPKVKFMRAVKARGKVYIL